MLTIFLQLWWSEKKQLNRLSAKGKRLLFSSALNILSIPLLTLFLNAFLWRQSHDIILVGLYNLFIFLGVPLGTYINGLALKRLLPTKLYLIGAIVQGVSVGFFILFSQPSYILIGLFGLLWGIGTGIFCGNKNLLTIRFTEPSNRIYFSSFEQIFVILTGIVVPTITGWFITYGEQSHLYLPLLAYHILFIIGIAILVMSGMIIFTLPTEKVSIKSIALKNKSEHWNTVRIFSFNSALLDGMNSFLPALMILSFVGTEDKFGIIQSFAAILSTIVVYSIAKKAKTNHRTRILDISILLLLIGASYFSALFSLIGVIFYIGLQSLATPFSWLSTNSLIYDVIESEGKAHARSHYSYVFDRELFLSLGRVLAIVSFFIMIKIVSPTFALRFGMLFFTLTQVGLLFLIRRIESGDLAFELFYPALMEEV